MSVFRNYNSNQAGGVNANAFPRVYSIPWVPTQRNVRSNPNIPSQPQRISPHERGTFFPTSASDSGSLAPAMASSASAGCGGGGSCAGCDSSISSSPPRMSSSGASVTSSFPVSKGTISRNTPRPQPRGVGALRPVPRNNNSRVTSGMRTFMGRNM